MNATDQTQFSPPTSQQLLDHLQRYATRRPSRWITMLPFIALGLIVALTFTAHTAAALLLPLLALAGSAAALSWRVRWLRQGEREAVEVQEMLVRRRYKEALAHGWRLLPRLRSMPENHGRTVAALAGCLDQLKAYDTAITAYDYLLDRLPSDYPGAVQLGIQRTMTQLMADRMTDADDALRRLRGPVEQYPHTPIAAAYRLAGLLQQVCTHHFTDAIAESDGMIESLRPLGIDAGFGYALMALSHYNIAPEQTPGAGAAPGAAALWWARATILLSPAALIERFDQLGHIAHLPATPVPEALTIR